MSSSTCSSCFAVIIVVIAAVAHLWAPPRRSSILLHRTLELVITAADVKVEFAVAVQRLKELLGG